MRRAVGGEGDERAEPMKDIDIWRTAQTMISEYGDDAVIVASQRIDALMALGDIDGRIAWRRIKSAIEDLLEKERPEGKLVN